LIEQIARSDPTYGAIGDSADPCPPEGVSEAIPAGGTLVLLHPFEPGIACFVLRSAEDAAGRFTTLTTSIARLPADNWVTKAETDGVEMVDALADRMLRPLTSGDPAAGKVMELLLSRLSRVLYPALAPGLPPMDRDEPPNLILVPSGALCGLPLHALPWPGGNVRLLDGYAVSYISSTDALVSLVRRPSVPAGMAVVAPAISGSPGHSESPAALAEASAIAAAADVSPLLRRDATVASLLDRPDTASLRWVHLVTHAVASGGGRAGSGLSGLLLYDEHGAEGVWLTAQEIWARLPLDGVEHLAISSCSTHIDDRPPGDRMAGLLRAFLYRGVRSVQATLWPVLDVAAALVDTWTWEALLAGEVNKARALRAAVLRLRTCSGPKAGAELQRIASSLPDGDPARPAVDAMATELQSLRQPFARTTDWAPFVLHGAPLVAPVQTETSRVPAGLPREDADGDHR